MPTRYDVSVVPDTAHKTFTGTVDVLLDVRKPTRTVVLNAAELTFSRVAMAGVTAAPQVSFDKAEETATLTFADKIDPGPHRLIIDYAGVINTHAAGLFALEYAAGKATRRVLLTQFENSDARRFMPCWDEPQRKAVFTLAVTLPAEEMAVSNTPAQRAETLPGGLKRVQFAPSPKMSTYLLFLGIGDFERVSRTVNGVNIGVVVRRGAAAQAAYALAAAAQLLPFYEDYFGQKFPLPKLDLVAGPGQSQFFGAMENWGAILYFEHYLLIDPAISTQEDRRNVYVVVAHEMAHQWFGDLVTMAWWDDLWLNEGFASWMEHKATDHFHPEWKIWLDSQKAKEAAMRVDARRGTHPIIQPIRDVLQANQAFDTITYSKGQAVIRMLEAAVGEDAFRAGVRSYMQAHAYGNTVTDDLWAELDKASSTPVTAIAHNFTRRAGVPLVHVATAPDGVRLTQDRFAEDDSVATTEGWQVPVVAWPLGARESWRGIVARGKPQTLPPSPPGILVNRGQSGYFRTLYDPAAFKALADNFTNLEPEDQLGMLNDARELGFTGFEPLAEFLSLVNQAAPDLHPQVLSTIAAQLEEMDSLYRDLPGQAAFRMWARRLLAPVFARLTWNANKTEDQNTTLLRADVLHALSQLGDPAVVADARKQFAKYLKDHAKLKGDLRESVLGIVAVNADAAAWDQIHQLARDASSVVDKQRLYGLLGVAHDRTLAQRALDLALSDEPPATARPALIRKVAAYYPDLAFDFVSAHFDVVGALLEPDSRNQFAPSLAGGSADPAMIPKLDAFARAHIPETARQPVAKAQAVIAFRAGVRTHHLPAVDGWLAAHPPPPMSVEEQKSLRKKLEAMLDSDQRYRGEIQMSMMRDPSPKNVAAAQKRFDDKQRPLDAKNLKALVQIVEKYGWPARSVVGYNGSQAAFLVLQHAEPAVQEKYFPALKAAADKGEAAPDQIAFLEDRIRMNQGKDQLYGTQFVRDEEHGGYKLYPIEDEKNVDARRAKVGLPTLAESLKIFSLVYTPPK